jgi:hypothetical protein
MVVPYMEGQGSIEHDFADRLLGGRCSTVVKAVLCWRIRVVEQAHQPVQRQWVAARASDWDCMAPRWYSNCMRCRHI